MSSHGNARKSNGQRGRELLKRAGYGAPADIGTGCPTINPTPTSVLPPGRAPGMVGGGAPGGLAPDKPAKKRLDKHARGGKVKGGSTMNVIIAMPPDGGGAGASPASVAPPAPAPGPVPVPPPMAAPAGPLAPPMPGGPAGGSPLLMRKRGGKVPPSKMKTPRGPVPMDAGALSGPGRLEKIENQRKAAR